MKYGRLSRLVVKALVPALFLALVGCHKKPEVKNTIEGNMETYYEMDDGTWVCNELVYQSRLEIEGRMPNASCDSVFVYLSNLPEEITFQEACLAAGVSSDFDDYFSAEEAVLVEMR